MFLPVRRVPARLKGGAEWVAGIAELVVAAGERCSWPRPVLTFPQKAVGGWWIVLTLLGLSGLHGSVSVGDSWLIYFQVNKN